MSKDVGNEQHDSQNLPFRMDVAKRADGRILFLLEGSEPHKVMNRELPERLQRHLAQKVRVLSESNVGTVQGL